MPERLNGINPLVDNFMSRRLGQTDKVKRKNEKDEEKEKKRRYYDKLNISHLGKLLNSIQEELKEKNNKKALSGFEKIMELIGRPPDNLIAVNFTDIVAALSEKNDNNFIRLFILADRVEESEVNLRNWINSLINFDLEQLERHLSLTEKFLNEDKFTNFEKYLKKINNIAMSQNLDINARKEQIQSILHESYFSY